MTDELPALRSSTFAQPPIGLSPAAAAAVETIANESFLEFSRSPDRRLQSLRQYFLHAPVAIARDKAFDFTESNDSSPLHLRHNVFPIEFADASVSNVGLIGFLTTEVPVQAVRALLRHDWVEKYLAGEIGSILSSLHADGTVAHLAKRERRSPEEDSVEARVLISAIAILLDLPSLIDQAAMRIRAEVGQARAGHEIGQSEFALGSFELRLPESPDADAKSWDQGESNVSAAHTESGTGVPPTDQTPEERHASANESGSGQADGAERAHEPPKNRKRPKWLPERSAALDRYQNQFRTDPPSSKQIYLELKMDESDFYKWGRGVPPRTSGDKITQLEALLASDRRPDEWARSD